MKSQQNSLKRWENTNTGEKKVGNFSKNKKERKIKLKEKQWKKWKLFMDFKTTSRLHKVNPRVKFNFVYSKKNF